MKRIEYNLQKIILIYSFMCLAYQILFFVVPTRMTLYDANLVVISQGLAVAGVAIFGLVLLYRKEWLINRYFLYVLVMMLIFIITAIANRKYGISGNIKSIVWQLDLMCVVFPCFLNLELEKAKKALCTMMDMVLLFWVSCIIASIPSFIFLRTYLVDYKWKHLIQGFINGRLFGIFNDPNPAGTFTLVLLVYIVCRLADQGIVTKIGRTYYIICGFVLYIYMLLGGSRGAIVAALTIVFLASTRRVFIKDNCRFQILKSVLIACLITILTALIINLSSSGIRYVPESLSKYFNYEINLNATLNREDTGVENISNNRIEIWKNYLEVSTSNTKTFIIGYSLSNYPRIIQEKHNDLYIVNHIKENNITAYKKGVIYDTHNWVIFVLVSTGIVGLIVLIAFLLKCFMDTIGIYYKKNISPYYECCMLTIAILVITALFDCELFYRFDFQLIVFWMTLGILLNIANNRYNENSTEE